MSISQALDIIAQGAGRDSNVYRKACILAAYGRRADIITEAAAFIPRGRNLAIAA